MMLKYLPVLPYYQSHLVKHSTKTSLQYCSHVCFLQRDPMTDYVLLEAKINAHWTAAFSYVILDPARTHSFTGS